MTETALSSEQLRPVDEEILAFLVEERTEYAAIVANRLGIHTPYAERRCAALAERGYLEAVSSEVVYRVTEQGRAAID